MMDSAYRGYYALVQFCPVPERMEFLNVGLLLTIPKLGYSKIEFVDEPKRVERLFGRQRKEYFQYITEATEFRLKDLLSHKDLLRDFGEFSERRANEIRLTNLLEIRIEGDADEEFCRLFSKLVEGQRRRKSVTRARTRLKKTFSDFSVEHLLDKPDVVELERFDLRISAPFAYQNGSYNLIDSIRLSENHSESLREAGKKAVEGSLLYKHSDLAGRMRLIVVADFSDQSVGFYEAIREHFAESDVGLYRFDEVHFLVDDIVKNIGKGPRVRFS